MYYSFRQAGKILDIDERAVSAMVRHLGIPVYRHPSNGRAKAIDQAGLETLRERLQPAALVS